MIKAKILGKNMTVSNLELGKVYVGEIVDEHLAKLNKNVSVKLENAGKEKKAVAVKILKITAPRTVVGSILKGEYVIAEETKFNVLVESEVISKLMPKFQDVKNIILNSINEGRHIIIKHHFDCDGYSGALALESVILPLIKNSRMQFFNFKKSPSRTPFYDYNDACRDLNNVLNSNHYVLPPLIILVDMGSTGQDLFSIRKLKLYGFKVVVIDHHFPGEIKNGKTIVDNYVDAHINPYLVGGNNSYTAGILCSELANLIKPSQKLFVYSALSAIADKSNEDIVRNYSKMFDRDYLNKVVLAIDFEAYHLRGMESRKLIQDLFDLKNKELVELSYNQTMIRFNKQLDLMKANIVKSELNGKKLVVLNLDGSIDKFSYPPAGRSVGYLFSNLKQKNLVVIGLASGFMIFRANVTGFNLLEMLGDLKIKFPFAGLDGGGHELAGTIKFFSNMGDKILVQIKEYIANLSLNNSK